MPRPPTVCPRGHQLGRGRVLLGWSPCTCPGTAPSGLNGHRTYQCTACLDEHVDTIGYTPKHTQAGQDPRVTVTDCG